MMRAAETPSRRAGTHIRTDAQLQSRRALACRLCLLCRVCVWLVRAVVVLFAGARSGLSCAWEWAYSRVRFSYTIVQCKQRARSTPRSSFTAP